MKYQIKSSATDEILFECYFEEEVQEFTSDCKEDVYVYQYYECRGCAEEEGYDRHDAYGNFTGYYCEECYSHNYPYRKDRYPTIEFDGYGERLSEDY